MNLVLALTVLATALNGLLAGLNVDTAPVKLPACHRIGAPAYATFARGNDLGNGLVIYALLGISTALLTVLTTPVSGIAAQPAAFLCHRQGGARDAEHQGCS